MRFKRSPLFTAAAALLATPFLAQAQSSTDLDQRLKVLERKLEIQDEAAAEKSKTAVSSSAGDKGFGLKSADGAYELKLKALVQFDARFFTDDANAFNDTFLFRRIRPSFEGSVGKLVGFRLTPEFAGNNATIVDAYVDLKFSPAATLRAGKVKGPVSLERLQSGGAISFVERGFPTELAPNRDLGIQLQGDLFSSTVNYTLGYYNGTADGRDAATTDIDNRREVGARLFFEPFRNEPGFFQGLGFGVGGTSGTKFSTLANSNSNDTTTNVKPAYRTPGQNTFFSYRDTVVADGTHTRISPQLYYYRNSFGLLAEHIESEQSLRRHDVAASTQDIKNTAWQVVSTFVLTGEDASFRGVIKPASPFTPSGDGWGALELALRYGELDIDDQAFVGAANSFADPAARASEVRSYGVGLNWYLTQNVKLATNYTLTSFEGGAAGGADRRDEKAIFTRIQLSY